MDNCAKEDALHNGTRWSDSREWGHGRWHRRRSCRQSVLLLWEDGLLVCIRDDLISPREMRAIGHRQLAHACCRSNNAFDGHRFEWTHVAPAFVQLSFASVLAQNGNHNWTATQELYEPMLNTTLAAGTAAEVHTSAVFAPEANIMTVRMSSAKATTLDLRLSTQLPNACSGHTSCMADLPMKFATTSEPDGGSALTMEVSYNYEFAGPVFPQFPFHPPEETS
eukprot:SAG31_NODE_7901_length_1569_cov_3.002398_2_plen_223_part_00